MIINELCKRCEGYTQPNGCVGEVIDGQCAKFRLPEDEYERGFSEWVSSCEDYGFPVDESWFEEDSEKQIMSNLDTTNLNSDKCNIPCYKCTLDICPYCPF